MAKEIIKNPFLVKLIGNDYVEKGKSIDKKDRVGFENYSRWDQREKVLEVVCGCVEFSIEASNIAD
ncbi:hypothetical protein [Clostridium sp. Cult2]|uniref:hypothetical protein n=1 Tax=Clostridium sp. Cult2 TaxID=2079003 RepID=UPI001F38CC3F|nr:hypothetical protein [Clostridium sp. Cult2]MCF6465772.1 hypothetical protein [Clostridium sp. Cult2]